MKTDFYTATVHSQLSNMANSQSHVTALCRGSDSYNTKCQVDRKIHNLLARCQCCYTKNTLFVSESYNIAYC